MVPETVDGGIDGGRGGGSSSVGGGNVGGGNVIDGGNVGGGNVGGGNVGGGTVGGGKVGGGNVGGGTGGGGNVGGGKVGGVNAVGPVGGGDSVGNVAGGSVGGGNVGGGDVDGGNVGGGNVAGGNVGGGNVGGGNVDGGNVGGGAAVTPAPSNVSATAESATTIRITWAPPTSVPTIYDLERGLASTGPFVLVQQIVGSEVTFLDSGLTPGATLWYRLRAVLNGTPSSWAGPVSSTLPILNAPPDAPTTLTVGSPTENSLTVSWTDASTNETSFEVQRAPTAQGPFFTFVTRPANSTSVVDTGIATGTPFHYRVRSMNALGGSAWSNQSSGITLSPNAPTMPAAVQEVFNNTSTVRFTWSDQSQAEGRYEVQRSSDGTNWPTSNFVPADSTSWTDAAPAFGMNFYRVRASSGLSVSSWAQTSVNVGPIVTGYFCSPPTAVSATAVGNLIRLGFTYQPFPCETVVIERGVAMSGPFNEIGRSSYFNVFPFPPRNTTWDDTAVLPGTTYYYRLRTAPATTGTMNFSGSGYTTPILSAIVTTPIAPPTNLQVTLQSSTEATFSFTDATSNETGFDVEIATAAAGPFSIVFQLNANVTTGGLAQMTPGTAYWLRVRTVRNGVQSPPSNVVAFTTPNRTRLVTTADVTVIESYGTPSLQTMQVNDFASVGCFFTAFPIAGGAYFQYYNCAGTMLQFNTSSLAGRTVVAAWLEMTPCLLAPGPVQGQLPSVLNASYAAFALAAPWNPATVTYNTAPNWYVNAPLIAAPTTSGPVLWNVTTAVRNWVNGTWAQNGLFVQQAPIVARVPPENPPNMRNQDQTTPFCSLQRTPSSAATLVVDTL
ncbi:MAG: fibronectin type III domain-containing protein [Myxococcales bacterium]|nr:fibronectin type III domain-containing protein [Myxococcales bacterium]